MKSFIAKLRILPFDYKKALISIFFIIFSTIFEIFILLIIYTLLSLSGDSSNDNDIVIYFMKLFTVDSILLIGLVGVILKIFFSFMSIKMVANFVYATQKDISYLLYKGKMLESYSDYEDSSASGFIRLIGSESQLVIKMIVLPIVSIIKELIPTISLFLMLLLIQPFASLLLITLLSILGYIFVLIFSKRVKIWGDDRKNIEEKITSDLLTTDRLFKEILIYSKQSKFAEKFYIRLKKLSEVSKKQNMVAELPKVILEVGLYSSIIAILGFFVILDNNINDAIPVIAIIGISALRIIPSVHRATSAANNIAFGIPALDLLVNEISKTKKSSLLKDKKEKIACDKLEVKNLSFKREDGKKIIFQDISFKLTRGMILGIRGESGSGKSTLLYSLAGLLETNSGEIYINDKKIDQSRIYKDFKVGIVPQQTYIMPGSIFENVTLRDNETDLNEDKATEAIRTSGLSTFLSEFQKGVKQELAENSKSISGGQAQRFSIARLIYKNSDILLLDEFTSALDKDTKKDLIQEIKKISRDKIILISSHTEDVLDICDEIIDMDKC